MKGTVPLFGICRPLHPGQHSYVVLQYVQPGMSGTGSPCRVFTTHPRPPQVQQPVLNVLGL